MCEILFGIFSISLSYFNFILFASQQARCTYTLYCSCTICYARQYIGTGCYNKYMNKQMMSIRNSVHEIGSKPQDHRPKDGFYQLLHPVYETCMWLWCYLECMIKHQDQIKSGKSQQRERKSNWTREKERERGRKLEDGNKASENHTTSV